MEYFVVGPDGQEYGPASVDTLKQWAQENRLTPDTMLKNFQSGQTVAAKSVPGIFQVNPPPVGQPSAAGFGQQYATPPTGYPRAAPMPTAYDSGASDVLVGYRPFRAGDRIPLRLQVCRTHHGGVRAHVCDSRATEGAQARHCSDRDLRRDAHNCRHRVSLPDELSLLML